MKKLPTTTTAISSPQKQLEFQKAVRGILSGSANFSPASSVESTPTASPAPKISKKYQKKGKRQATQTAAVADVDGVFLETQQHFCRGPLLPPLSQSGFKIHLKQEKNLSEEQPKSPAL
jgi:hypothetical protein